MIKCIVGGHHRFLVLANEVPEIVQLVLNKELWNYCLSEVKSEHQVGKVPELQFSSQRFVFGSF